MEMVRPDWPVAEPERLDPVEAGGHLPLREAGRHLSTMVPMAVFRLPTMSLM